jgi:SAM-dependent methyltransferase
MSSVISNYIRKSPHRNQLEKYIRAYLPKVTGRVLDVGSKNRRYDWLLKNPPTAVDITENKSKNVLFGNILNLPFDAETFDAVISFEVLEYINNPEQAIIELSRVVKRGGQVLISVPFMYKNHDDKLRYTSSYLEEIFLKHFSSVQCTSIGNAYTVILDVTKGKINEVSFRPLRYLYLLWYLPFALLIELLTFRGASNYASGYFIVAQK